MSRSRDYVDGIPTEIAERILRAKRRKKGRQPEARSGKPGRAG